MVSNLDCINQGVLIVESGDTVVYKLNEELFMESGVDKKLISAEDDLRNYVWQLGKKPQGDILILGLGLGFNVKYILSLPKIKSVTVVEPNINIVTCQQQCLQSNFNGNRNVNIVCGGFFKYMYEVKDRFDFVFIDCYRQMDGTTWPLVADLVTAATHVCKVNGKVAGWVDDSASEYWLNVFKTLF